MKQWEEGQENGEENGKIVDGVIIKQELPDYGTQMNGQPTGEQILFFVSRINIEFHHWGCRILQNL